MNRLALLLLVTLVGSLYPRPAAAQPAPAAVDEVAPKTQGIVARLQFIHNAFSAGEVDVYVDGQRVWDDMAALGATAFYEKIPEGDRRIDIVPAAAPDNSAPLWSTMFTFKRDENYVMAALGDEAGGFVVRIEDKARLAALTSDVEFMLIHGAPDVGPVDIRIHDPVNGDVISLLANNFSFGNVLGYQNLSPAGYNIQVTDPENTAEIEVFRFELHRFGGEALVMLITGSGTSAKEGFTMVGFDIKGRPVTSAVITDTEAEAGLPEIFALDGNYPNPFNPSTTIQFDLPETAEVAIQVIDVLGRRVLTIPSRVVEAGTNRSLRVDAAALASGTYIYRVIARTATDTMVKTGRMTLVR